MAPRAAVLITFLVARPALAEPAAPPATPPVVTPAATPPVVVTPAATPPVVVTPPATVTGARPGEMTARRGAEEPEFSSVIDVAGAEGAPTPLVEALDARAGISVRRTGGPGAFVSLSLRGASAAQTTILVDGVPLSQLAFSAVDLASLDLDTFSRVDVYRGAAPAALGGGLGGALELVTGAGPTAGRRETRLTLGGGSFGARRARVVHRALVGTTRLTLAAGYAGARGDFTYFDDGGTPLVAGDDSYRERANSGYDRVDAAARLRRGAVEGGLRLGWKRQGVAGPVGVSATVAALENARLLADAGARRRLGPYGVEGKLYALLERQAFSDPAAEIGPGAQERRYTTLALGGQAGGTRRLGRRQRLQGELEARLELFAGDDLLDPRAASSGTRATLALALADRVLLDGGRWLLVPGVRLDALATRGEGRASVIGREAPPDRAFLSLAPRLAARRRLAPGVALKANAGWSFRAPTLVELFGDHGAIVGNAELLPEHGVVADAGLVSGPGGRVELEAAVFAARVEDLIALVPTAGGVARAENLALATLAGVELQGTLRPRPWLAATASYTLLESRQGSAQLSLDGRRLPGRPRHEAFVRLEARRRDGRLPLAAHAQVTLASGNFLDAGNLEEVPARRLLGVGVRLSLGRGLVLTLSADNLLDERVEGVSLDPPPRPDLATIPRAVADVLGYPLPGRSFSAALDWTL